MHATCHSHSIILDLIIQTYLAKRKYYAHSSLCSFPSTSRHIISLLSKYFPQHSVLNHPSSVSAL
jgi:hypothetical protein